MASIRASLFSNKSHLTKEGLTQIINILYNVPNKYNKYKDYWLELIEKQKFKKNKDLKKNIIFITYLVRSSKGP